MNLTLIDEKGSGSLPALPTTKWGGSTKASSRGKPRKRLHLLTGSRLMTYPLAPNSLITARLNPPLKPIHHKLR